MATFRASPLLSSLSGSIGSMTFVTSGHGNVVRHRPQRSQEKSLAQTNQSAFYHQCQNQWKALTAAQQIAWNTAAQWPWRKSTTSPPCASSGHLLFMTVNLQWHRFDSDFVTTPAKPLQGIGLKYFVPDAAPGTILIAPVNGDFSQAGSYLVHGARSFRNATLTPCPRAFHAWRLIGRYTLAAPYTAFEIITQWNAILGALTYREWYAVTIRLLSPKGTVSNPLTLTAYRNDS